MSRTARYSFMGTRGLRPRGVTVYFRTDLVGTLLSPPSCRSCSAHAEDARSALTRRSSRSYPAPNRRKPPHACPAPAANLRRSSEPLVRHQPNSAGQPNRLQPYPHLFQESRKPAGFGEREEERAHGRRTAARCEIAGSATDPLPATRLPSTLHECCRYPFLRHVLLRTTASALPTPRTSATKAWRLSLGLCIDCGNPPREGSSRCDSCLSRIAGIVWRSKVVRAFLEELTCRHAAGEATDCRICRECVKRFVKANEADLREAARLGRSPKIAAAVAARDKWLRDQQAKAVDTSLEDEFGPEIAAIVRRNPDRGAPPDERHGSRYGWLDAVRR